MKYSCPLPEKNFHWGHVRTVQFQFDVPRIADDIELNADVLEWVKAKNAAYEITVTIRNRPMLEKYEFDYRINFYDEMVAIEYKLTWL